MSRSSNLNNGTEWELSKENIQPVKQGRKVANLSAALGDSSNEYQSRLHREIQAFETGIRTYEGNDPLEVWYRYLLWLCENFPTGGKDEHVLLERCITVFKDEEKYKNDERYLKIWLRYADLSQDPVLVYEYMHSQEICNMLANFYEYWAYVFEMQGNVKKADELYNLGKAKNAQPLERLQRQHREFEIRLAENIGKSPDESIHENEKQRKALGGLKSHGKRGTVGVKRTGNASIASKVGGVNQSLSSNNCKSAGFTVFDENTQQEMPSIPVPTGEWQVPPTRPVVTKENTQKPGKWNEAKLSQRHQRNVPVDNVGLKPLFTVHEDEETTGNPPCTPQHHTLVDQVLSSRKPDKGGTNELLKIIAKTNEKDDKKFKVMYCKDKIYAGAKEFSFEQLRAARMLARLKDGQSWSSLYTRQQETNKTKFKVMYSKNEVYPLDSSERPYDEVLLKRYFAIKEKRRQQKLLKMPANVALTCPGSLNEVNNSALHISQSLDQMVISDYHAPKQSNSPFEVFIDPESKCSNNQTARRGLSFNTIKSQESSNVNLIYQDPELPSATPAESLTVSGTSSASHLVPKGLSRRPLGDRPVPSAEERIDDVSIRRTANTTCPSVSLSRNPDIIPEMQQQLQPLACASNPPLSNNQQSFEDVAPSNRSGVNNFGSHALSGADNFASSPTVTMNTRAAQDVVMAMFNNPLGFDHDDVVPWMKPQDISSTARDFEAAFKMENRTETVLPSSTRTQGFTIFDETDAVNHRVPSQNTDEENQENRPPSNYFQEKTKRPIAGVLQPSLGIPVCSEALDDEEDQDMEDDENLPPVGFYGDAYNKTICDVTENANNYLSTSSFKMAARMASTPYSQAMEPPTIDLSNINLTKQQENDFTSAHDELFACTPNKTLSPIFERSDEDARSNASSSSSSATSSSRGSVSQHITVATKLESIVEERGVQKFMTSEGRTRPDDLCQTRGNLTVQNILNETKDYVTDVDPFSPEEVERLLKGVVPRVSSYDGYFICQEELPKISKKLAIVLGQDDLYQVKQPIGAGSFAKVFSAYKLSSELDADDNDKTEVILKVQKTPNDWEFYICRQLHSRIDEFQCARETHTLFMNPYKVYNYGNGSVLVDQFSRLGTVLDVANMYRTTTKCPEEIAVSFVRTLLRMIITMHRCGIIHGDIKPDNILMLESSSYTQEVNLKFIDFGQGIDMQLYPPGTMFSHNSYNEVYQCTEMKTNHPWTIQVDTFALLGVIYCLIHGDYMKVYESSAKRWKPMNNFKRHWHVALWNKLFDLLLNTPNPRELSAHCEMLLQEFIDYPHQATEYEIKSLEEHMKSLSTA